DRETSDFGADATTATAAAAARVGAAETLLSLTRIIQPWAREFAVVVLSGIGRVAFFIGVGILGALAVAAVKTGAPFAWLLIALLQFVLYAALAPVVMRARIDRLGAEARDALGLLSAYVTETIQGLSDLVAFQAVAGRRAGFMETVRGYQTTRLRLLSDLSSQTAPLEVVTGLGGLGVAVAGAWLVANGEFAATNLLLLFLLLLASFLPISEIAQVSRQL